MINFGKAKKRKQHRRLMLWISEDILERIDILRPKDVTKQECIRLLVEEALIRLEKQRKVVNVDVQNYLENLKKQNDVLKKQNDVLKKQNEELKEENQRLIDKTIFDF